MNRILGVQKAAKTFTMMFMTASLVKEIAVECVLKICYNARMLTRFNLKLLKNALFQACLLALAFAVIFVPLSMLTTYWHFFDEFSANVSEVLTFRLSFALVLFVLFSLLLYISKTRKIAFTVISAISLLTLLESGLLSIGLSPLNGNLHAYGLLVRRLLDSLLWVGVITLFIKYRKQLYSNRVHIVVGLLLYSLAATTDAYIKKPEKIITSFITNIDVYDSVELSRDNNVIMLMLDTVSSEVAEDVFEHHPELAAQYEGFINFTNNVGIGLRTNFTVPTLFTGKYFDTSSYNEHLYRIIDDNDSLVRIFQNVGYDVAVQSFAVNWISKPRSTSATTTKQAGLYSSGFFETRLDNLALLRVMPYLLKKDFIRNIQTGAVMEGKAYKPKVNKYKQDRGLDFVRSVIENAPLTAQPTFQFYHFLGAHDPLMSDDNCSNAPKLLKEGNDYNAYYKKTYCALKGTADILQAIKQRAGGGAAL
ncbi:hypothetical protein RsTz2092_08430 [Deferribacterales bacterium RsTz2092]|nr:hypothetical protein AGMMS49941_05730 [Deferribacterales bacterium]